MAKRDKPNDYFAWYNDDNRLAVVVRQEATDQSKGVSAGEYDTYLDTTITDGLRMTIHSKYESVSAITDDLETDSGLDSMMHSFILDYVKSRILEDIGQAQQSVYFRTKFENGIQKKPTRKSGIRTLLVPNL